MRHRQISAEPGFVDRRGLRLKRIGRKTDPPEQKIAVGLQPRRAIRQAHHIFPRRLKELEEFAARLPFVIVGDSSKRRVELEECEADELALNPGAGWFCHAVDHRQG